MECVRCGTEICREELAYCSKCESPHHQHCWESHDKKCGYHGCAQTDLILKQVYELANKGDYNCARHVLAENMDLMTNVDPYDVLEDLRESEINYHKLKAERRLKIEESTSSIFQILMMAGFFIFIAFVFYHWTF